MVSTRTLLVGGVAWYLLQPSLASPTSALQARQESEDEDDFPFPISFVCAPDQRRPPGPGPPGLPGPPGRPLPPGCRSIFETFSSIPPATTRSDLQTTLTVSSSTSRQTSQFFFTITPTTTFSRTRTDVSSQSSLSLGASSQSSQYESSTSLTRHSTDPPRTNTLTSSTTRSCACSMSAAPAAGASGDDGHDRKLLITLCTVLSLFAVVLIAGGVFIFYRYRRGRFPFGNRGATPIDDEEIEAWRTGRPSEKDSFRGVSMDTAGRGIYTGAARPSRHSRQQPSTSSSKKPPSLIVYQNRHPQMPRRSEEFSPRSIVSTSIGYPPAVWGRPSMDKDLPQTPTFARAPNARTGLTDETIPGDPSFITTPKRYPSRLSKMPPGSTPPRSSHGRTRSSRSSMRSFIYGGSEVELQLSPRASSDQHNWANRKASRAYSSSSVPPRLSLDNDVIAGGLSPRPLFRDDIGRAIG